VKRSTDAHVFPPAETLGSLKQPRADRPPAASPPQPRRDSDRYCQLCAAWFNNPVKAQQHYDGKKHKKNAARAELLEQLGKTLDLGELRGESAGLRGAHMAPRVHPDGMCCFEPRQDVASSPELPFVTEV